MNEREYERLKKLVEDEYRKKLDALEVVWQMAREAQPPVQRAIAREPFGNGSRRATGAGIADAITVALPRLGSEFTVKDVEPLVRAASSEQIDRSTISHALKRLAQSRFVEVVRIGRGKRPTLYRATNSLPPDVAADNSGSPQETATEELAREIRKLASNLKLDRDEFRAKHMHGHNKLVEMPLAEAQALLDELKGMTVLAK